MKKLLTLITMSLIIGLFTACTSEEAALTINEKEVSLGEVTFILREFEAMYEGQPEVWTSGSGGKTFSEVAKEAAVESTEKLYVAKVIAEEKGLHLTEEENEVIERLVQQYLTEVSESQLKEDGVTVETLRKVFENNAVVQKLMDAELSDFEIDEARLEADLANDAIYGLIQAYGYEGILEEVTTQHILIATVNNDEGNTEKTDDEKEKALKTAEMVYKKVKAGGDFDELVKAYSEDPLKDENNGYYTFVKGKMPLAFEDAAFSMGVDEVTELVETEAGYHIIKKIDHVMPTEDEVKNVMDYEKYTIEQYELLQQQEEYNRLVEEWSAGITIVRNEKVLEKLHTTYEQLLESE